MVIDFHTHAFPDKIASGALKSLMNGALTASGAVLTPCTDGTLTGLKSVMQESGIDKSVVLPIATRAGHHKSINDFAYKITKENEDITSFASLHPKSDDYDYILKEIAEQGFKGIKLHPEFQDSFIDSKESIGILSLAERLGLYTVIHAGRDAGFLPPTHATPERIANVLKEISGERLICAHLGGWKMWDDVERYLVGTPVMFDTAYTAEMLSKEQAQRIIKAHGANKILFGSDAPWQSPKVTLDFIKSLDLTAEEFDLITYKNALEIIAEKNVQN